MDINVRAALETTQPSRHQQDGMSEERVPLAAIDMPVTAEKALV